MTAKPLVKMSDGSQAPPTQSIVGETHADNHVTNLSDIHGHIKLNGDHSSENVTETFDTNPLFNRGQPQFANLAFSNANRSSRELVEGNEVKLPFSKDTSRVISKPTTTPSAVSVLGAKSADHTHDESWLPQSHVQLSKKVSSIHLVQVST